ncbi:2-isopropylmalate synthase [Pokkaliibacter sp. CJK22405]|uniref:2-isopropylmalate synthase n=1 Tax=Pokkaliibacter sp. CJK22405 TaxID=3384615 RepID=UPI003984814B
MTSHPASPVSLFDTTLRDGEQTPGLRMSPAHKLRIAELLERLGVDVIEAGFPAASPVEIETLQAIGTRLRRTTLCALARATAKDIEAAAKALETAQKPRLHTFIATSPLHRQHKLRLDKTQVIERAVQAVTLARRYCDEVQFSAEDAFRTEPEFLAEVLQAAVDAGATILNVPDTVGYALPHEIRQRFALLQEAVIPRTSTPLIWSAHCHDDLGLATANSLAAVQGGARQVEGCVLGLGERAGNAALEEIIMALETRLPEYRAAHAQPPQIGPVCRDIAELLGLAIAPGKAIVGANAFAHESGIHQDGVLKHASTYEVITPERVGWQRSTDRLHLGKLSGRAALFATLQQLGITVAEQQKTATFERFKALASDVDSSIDEATLRQWFGQGG